MFVPKKTGSVPRKISTVPKKTTMSSFSYKNNYYGTFLSSDYKEKNN